MSPSVHQEEKTEKMVGRILKTYAERLNEFLSRYHSQPEGLAEVGLVGNNSEGCPNKIVVSLLNLERETAELEHYACSRV